MKKILIVDDEAILLAVMKRILSKDYEVVCAASGSEALELFDREKPDLVLSDLRMPEMDGYELRNRLREKGDVPFIFMTADDSNESESKGFEIGAADYIRKPANPEVLLRRIGNIVRNIDRIHGLKEAASLDPMTQMYNKATVEKAIGALCQSVPGVLMLIDLDSFKLVNDIYGHDMGDRILMRFADLIRKMIRSTDVAGRLGGDEFLVYLRYVKDAAVVREKTADLNEQLLRSAVEYMGENMGIPLGASVGAVLVPEEGRDFTELCKKADQALYQVKNQGKHTVAFYGAPHSSRDRAIGGRDISQARKILGERNPEPGAFLLDFERFQSIYRYILRVGGEAPRRTQFLHLTLQPDVSRETAEAFLGMLLHILRSSDCVMQNGSLQFLVLLTNAGEEEGKWVRERIYAKWAEHPEALHCSVTCDIESLGSMGE